MLSSSCLVDDFVHSVNTRNHIIRPIYQRSIDDMDSMNDEEDGDCISCAENQSQSRVRVASLEKLVDYCAEEFSKLHVAFSFSFLFCIFSLPGKFVCFSNSLDNRSRHVRSSVLFFRELLCKVGPVDAVLHCVFSVH